MFEFLCGGLSELRSRRTTAYEIGGEVRILTTSTTRTLPGRKSVSTAMSDTRSSSRHNGGGAAPGPSLGGEEIYTNPYTYGNPIVWLGSNVLIRSLQMVGFERRKYNELEGPV